MYGVEFRAPMKWIQAREMLPHYGKAVILAKKSIYIRPGQENKSTFFTVHLVHPHDFFPEFDKSLYFWCKAALHVEQKHEFNIQKYLEEKSQSHIGEMERTYLKLTPLDYWLDLTDPEPKVDFDIS